MICTFILPFKCSKALFIDWMWNKRGAAVRSKISDQENHDFIHIIRGSMSAHSRGYLLAEIFLFWIKERWSLMVWWRFDKRQHAGVTCCENFTVSCFLFSDCVGFLSSRFIAGYCVDWYLFWQWNMCNHSVIRKKKMCSSLYSSLIYLKLFLFGPVDFHWFFVFCLHSHAIDILISPFYIPVCNVLTLTRFCLYFLPWVAQSKYVTPICSREVLYLSPRLIYLAEKINKVYVQPFIHILYDLCKHMTPESVNTYEYTCELESWSCKQV